MNQDDINDIDEKRMNDELNNMLLRYLYPELTEIESE